MRKYFSILLMLLAFMAASAFAADTPADRVLSETGQSAAPAESADALQKVAGYLAADKEAKSQLSGFIDTSGDPAQNAELAKTGALAVNAAPKADGVPDERNVLHKPDQIVMAGNPDEARALDVTLAAAPAPAAAAAPAATTAPAPAAAPTFNKGDTAWMMVSTLLVIMMTVPGLALFYGGLVRSKNMLSVLMQVMVTFSMIVVLWMVYGYSLAFTEGNAFIGGFDRLFMHGMFDAATGVFAATATFTKGVYIPELLYAAFQATFAGIATCLIVGAFAERAKFAAVLMFTALWFTFSYVPIAHMVWFWMGPDAYSSASVVDATNAKAGLMWQWGALDFAGGTVVHINAAVAALVGAYVVGKRVGYGREAFTPHSLTLTMVGAALLWVGWFGFNAGSALEANTSSVLAFMNTLLATAAAVLAWCLGEALTRGKASMLGAASGAVSGLVAVTPAAGNVGLVGALVIGLVAGFACLWGVNGLKRLLGADDSLDVFGVHGIGGIVGALLTGVFNTQVLGGPGMVSDWVTATVTSSGIGAQLWIQFKAVLLTVAWSGVVSWLAYKVTDLTIGLRVSEEHEREGLDITSHGETAYTR